MNGINALPYKLAQGSDHRFLKKHSIPAGHGAVFNLPFFYQENEAGPVTGNKAPFSGGLGRTQYLNLGFLCLTSFKPPLLSESSNLGLDDEKSSVR